LNLIFLNWHRKNININSTHFGFSIVSSLSGRNKRRFPSLNYKPIECNVHSIEYTQQSLIDFQNPRPKNSKSHQNNDFETLQSSSQSRQTVIKM
jgi:hypothetical protein